MNKVYAFFLGISIFCTTACAKDQIKIVSEKSISPHYYIGPERYYKQIQEISSFLIPGDTVYVDGNATYTGGIILDISGSSEKRIVLAGINRNGKRPVITGGVMGIKVNGNYITIKGFEITSSLKAGIGHFANEIIINDCIIHDNLRDGIIGWGSLSGSLTVEYTELYHNGLSSSSPFAHQIYMATDETMYPNAVFRLQFCYIHDGNGGNNVKTRSGRNEFYYNWIEGAVFHGLELIGPDPEDNSETKEETKREDSDIVGNVIIVTPGMCCVRVGGDGTGQTWGRYRFVNNTFILNGKSDVIRGYAGVQTIELYNNAIVNSTSKNDTRVLNDDDLNWSNQRQVFGSNNWIQSGVASIPVELTNTFIGTFPGFKDLANKDLRLASGSELINRANQNPLGSDNFPFPHGLFPADFHPPLHCLKQESEIEARPSSDIIDIGAFEFIQN